MFRPTACPRRPFCLRAFGCLMALLLSCHGETNRVDPPDEDARPYDAGVWISGRDVRPPPPPPGDSGPNPGCPGGALAEPLPNCHPAPLPSSGDYYEDCVDRINQLRAECQCLPPLARWKGGESCADEHSEYDSEPGRPPHAGFQERICSPGGFGQNECPAYPSTAMLIGSCLQAMWDEGPGEDFDEHGHYLNMTNSSFSEVACGLFTTPRGDVWSVQNFR